MELFLFMFPRFQTTHYGAIKVVTSVQMHAQFNMQKNPIW